MSSDKFFTVPMFLLALLTMVLLDSTDAQIGVCYGWLGNALPPASEVVALYRQHNIRGMRLYDPHIPALQALGRSNIELMLSVPNDDLESLVSSQKNASDWIQTNMLPYRDVNFKYLAVGNNISPFRDESRYINFLLPAMRNLQKAISAAGLGDRINVSTAIDTGLTTSPYPPSSARFRPEAEKFINPIIQFLVNNSSPLLLNIQTYLIYTKSPEETGLDFALFQSKGIRMGDGVLYQNLFDVMLDATSAAVENVARSALQIVVSESAWPSDGGDAATLKNAETYHQNLVKHVKKGSPRRPGPIETYIFALFDEDEKEPELEKHWGLFYPDKRPKYHIPELNMTTTSELQSCNKIDVNHWNISNGGCRTSGEHYAACF